MKAIVRNRNRLGFLSKAKLAWIALRENGALYSFYLGLSYVGAGLSEFGFRKSDALRKARNLPGVNSPAANRHIWENWNWGAAGEEWTPSASWKVSVVRTFIDPYFRDLDCVVEIGPGAGRWTEYLIERVGRLIGIDISEACVIECRKRFSSSRNATFEVGSGCDLASVLPDSVDGIWSFDVFVHVNRNEFRTYVGEFDRVLKRGGVGVIHHGTAGGSTGGWRSDVTLSDVRDLMDQHGLEITAQVTSWEDGGMTHEAGLYGDAITVFRKT